MRRTLLPLLASLAFTSLISLADGAAIKVMSAPNLLRVGTEENIFVECQNCPDQEIAVTITVKDLPAESQTLAQTSVVLNRNNNFQAFGKITFKLPEDAKKNPNVKQYVSLQAQFNNGNPLKKEVLVSSQSGYIFIQTDKTIYTPNTKVLYRMFAVTPQMKPVEKDEKTQSEPPIAIEFETPDGIILPVASVSPKAGVHSGDYLLPELVSPGLWKVVAKFQSNSEQSYSANFEVKEYVLPSFEVKLTPESTFFYVDSNSLTVSINAKYLFGEDVYGTAFVVFGVIQNKEKTGLPASLQRVPVQNGEAEVTLRREHITASFKTVNELVGHSIFVSVSVLTESGSEMVEAELKGIQIVSSPYTIHFRKTPQYFKPGMTFDVAVEVLNPDESPAKGIEVVINPGGVRGFTGQNGGARLAINTGGTDRLLTITAETNDKNITPERQATASMKALPYTSKTSNYIHISLDTADLQLGDNLKVNLNFDRQQPIERDITLLILSRGQLVGHKRFKYSGNTVLVHSIPIEENMLPSFRLVAYYHPHDNEVVSDSVWVDVKDSCMGSLKLEPKSDARSYQPRKTFNLKVTGDPGATVGLVAVDKGVYVLNNKHRLTQKKVWDVVEKSDTGCSAGSGTNSMGVFYDAGLLFETDTVPGTPDRHDISCPVVATRRRKRAATITNVTQSLLHKYKNNKIQSECCLDGMRDIPVSYNCQKRSTYIVDGPACVEAFLYCCEQMTTQRGDMKVESLKLARSDDDDPDYMDSKTVISRTQFPESWLWEDHLLPACPDGSLNCPTTKLEKSVPLYDSITTWQLTGISLSPTRGICISEPLEVIVKKNFFIDLRVPYSAVRGEQIEIRAILHNYNDDPITVRLDLMDMADVCSSASKRTKYRQEIEVGVKTTQSVPFIIIPMKEGSVNIEVKGVVKDSGLNDGIMKTLRVVSQGVLVKTPQIITLNPAQDGADGKQEVTLNSRIPRSDLVPDSPTKTFISLTGREELGELVENAISGKSMGTLIYQPSGCGEQNMIHMTLPVIATLYLDRTDQWADVGFKKRAEALQHIQTGYTNELVYRKNDGSFSVWKHTPPSSWLTAYVAKVFSMAESLIALKREVICDAIKYLILNAQQPDGMFREVGTVAHGEMIGDVRGSDSDASMTAFSLIAMQESRELCSATVNSVANSIDKAVSYLEKRLPSLTNPYAVAMTSYALANENKLNTEILFRFRSPDSSHWPVPKGHKFTLEATAYALLALVKTKAFKDAGPVVRWFTKQQFVGGGYGSTQSTIMVYQAVSEYWASAKEPEYNLEVDIQLPGRSLPDKFSLGKENLYATRTTRFNDINQDVTVVATGNGEATVKMVSMYYAHPKETQSDCDRFNMTVDLDSVKQTKEESVYKLTIKVLYKKDHDSTMAILDIGLLTGFTIDTKDLDALSQGHAPIISKYEMNTALSEKGSLIIYLDRVSHSVQDEVSFKIHRKLKVGVLQPAAVSVYEYYDETRCVKFYHPQRDSGQLLLIKNDDLYTCAEENCSKQKKEKVSDKDRLVKLCESTPVSKIEYAYKVTVENIVSVSPTDAYSMRITQTIKEGIDVSPDDQLRIFIGYQHCREALNITTGSTYLVMGSTNDMRLSEKTQTFQYVLGERTWIEYWPTITECQTDKHRETCLGLTKMIHDFTNFPCKN